MGCISSKPAVKEAAGSEGEKSGAAGATPEAPHAAAVDVEHAGDADVDAAAAAPHAAREDDDDTPPDGLQHREEEACAEPAADAPLDYDAALHELHGRVQRRAAELAQPGRERGAQRAPAAAPSGELLLDLAQLHARIEARAGSRG